jgi:uncharacterized protein with von Willebrand factor type A (vWA) domain
MKVWRYSRWDGSQAAFTLDAEQALDALGDGMMEGLSLAEALDWMRRAGFELAGLDLRVMGLEELMDELRGELRALEQQVRMDQATDELRRRLDEILDREERAQRETSGYESRRMNEFLERRHAPAQKLSERIERFRDWSFGDEAAGEAFAELLEELDRLRGLEDFLREHGARFRGSQPADYETAQRIRERMQALERLLRDLAEGNLEPLDPEQLGELLSQDALRSLIVLRDLEPTLRRAGFLRDGQRGAELTPKAIRRIGAQALAAVYGALRKGSPGVHDTTHNGVGLPRPDETRPWQFGDAFDVDVVRSLLNAVKRNARDPIAPATTRSRAQGGRPASGAAEGRGARSPQASEASAQRGEAERSSSVPKASEAHQDAGASRQIRRNDGLEGRRSAAAANRPAPFGAPANLAISWQQEDLEVRETDYHTRCTTVLALDMSWSMSWAGRFPAAKRVALALDHLIRTRYPRDHFFVVGFSTRARELRIPELPEASWDMGEPFTNLQEALMVAERLIARHPSPSAQVLVITDGQPTAYFRGRELRVEWPMGFGGVSPHAAAETLQQVRRITRRGVTINTFMLDASPELIGFVEQMTRINKGRALYTSPARLGSYVMVDYLSRRRRQRTA